MDAKNLFITFLIIVGTLLLVAVLIYLISRLVVQGRVLVSQPAKGSSPEADQYYYLPGYGLKLHVNGEVELTRQDGIIQLNVLTLKVLPEVKLQADTSRLFTLNYISDPFANDELKITTSTDSLLQNVSSDVTDRIANIVNLFTAAPKDLLTHIKEGVNMVPPPRTVVPFSQDFLLFPQDLHRGETTLVVKIASNGETMDLLLNLQLPGFVEPDLKEFGGLFTRPMANQTWEIVQTPLPEKPSSQPRVNEKPINGDAASQDKDTKEEKTNADPVVSVVPPILSSFTLYAPDYSRVIQVPVRRAFFARHQQLPSFSNGLLIENHITKNSEMEGFASIPLNILKAIFSIPAQLFQFRITHNKLETEYEKSALELLKAQEATRLESIQQWAVLKEEIKSLTTQVSDLKDPKVPPQEQVPPLGKLPPSPRPPSKSFLETLPTIVREVLNVNKVQTSILTIVPQAFWNKGFTGTLNNYGNTLNGLQTCVPAAAAHMITYWTANAKGKATILSDKEVLDAYIRESNYNPINPNTDVGCSVLNFLSNWQFKGIGGNKIRTFSDIVKQQRDDIKRGIFLFGPCMVGLQMPKTARSQKGGTWKFVDGPGSEPGSWGERGGGHAVAAIGYDEEGLFVISWGQRIKMDWKFYETYNDETYVALSADWLTANNTSPLPASINLATLESTISKMSNA